MSELFDYINEATEKAKGKRAEQLARFHLGDIVYPLYQTWRPTLWGTVVEINSDIHKINVNINGIIRQYDPEELVLTNPELKPDSKYNQEMGKMIEKASKSIKASFSNLRKTKRAFKANVMFYKDIDNDEFEVPRSITIMAPNLETAKQIVDQLCEEQLVNEGYFDYSVHDLNEQNCEDAEKKITASEDIRLGQIRSASRAYSHILGKLKSAGKITGLFSDQDWSGIYGVIDYVKSLGVDAEREFIDSSNYRTNGGTKEWHYVLSFMNDSDERIELHVYLIASAAGTVEDPWSQYDIIMALKDGKVISREKAESKSGNSNIMPAYREWKHNVRQCAVDSNKGLPYPRQYDEFLADCLNEISLAEIAGKKLDMDSFREHLINSMFAFKTAYEIGRSKVSDETKTKLEVANMSCDKLSIAMNITL